MTHGGSTTETLWRDLIADEVQDWLASPEYAEAFEDADLVEFIRTGNKEEK